MHAPAGSSAAFVQAERRLLANAPQRSCFRRRKRLLLSLVALISLLASITFFFVTGYLIWTTVDYSMVLFVMAVFFFMETLGFAKYFVDIVLLKREKASWHLARNWVPLADFSCVLAAVFVESLLLPPGALADFVHQLGNLEPVYFWMSIQSCATLLVKLLSAVVLTIVHNRTVKRLLAAKYRTLDPEHFPWSRDVELMPALASAPPDDEDSI